MPRWFEVLLRTLPEEFRRRYSDDIRRAMERDDGTETDSARRRRWVRAGLDLVAVSISLRIRSVVNGLVGMIHVEGMMNDLRFAVHALARRPGFTLVGILTLGIGVGANTAIYSVVDGVLLRPLPYADADRIGILWHEFGDGAQDLPAVHALDARDYRDRSELLEDLTIAGGREWVVGGQDDPEIVDVGTVEAGFFEFFGATPLLGRTIGPEHDVPGAAPTVVLSHRLWVRRFGSDPDIVGRTIRVAGASMEVLGVIDESFRLHLPAEAFRLRDAEIWTPLRLDPARQPPRNFTGYTAFARIRPGVSFESAQQEIERLADALRAEHPEHAASNLEARIVPLHDDVVKRAESMLFFLLGATGFVLLIACANVTNLVMVRGHGRAREFALRTALGAGRGRLVRLALAEAAVLGGLGVIVGVGLAVLAVEILRGSAAASVPMLDGVTVDARVLSFAVLAGLTSVGVVGLIPALRGTSHAEGRVVGSGARSTGSPGQRRFRDALVIGEVAASLLLLVGTGLMIRSFLALGTVEPGFEVDDVLTMRVSLPPGGFPTTEDRIAVRRELFDEIEGLPGVTHVAGVNQLPLTGSGALQPYAYDEETSSNWESVTADQRNVSLDFFQAIGARFVEGGGFGPADMEAGNAIVIDDRLAQRAFPAGGAVGSRLQVNPNDAPEHIRYARVVGVVEHLRLHDLSRPHLTQIWFPISGPQRFSLVVRADGDAAGLAADIRGIIGRLAPGTAVQDVRTMRDLADTSLAPVRLTLTLMGAFGFIALVLATVGLYGVLSWTLSQRTHEIGVRMALGQSPADVRRLVFGDGGRLVAVALVAGLAASIGLARVASGLVYGVSVFDPVTYLATVAVLGSAAAVACWAPARRATRIEPTEALRDSS